MATDTIDPFCANCLPATVSPEALAKLQQQPDVWYLAQILVNIAFQTAQTRGSQDGSTPIYVKELALTDDDGVTDSTNYQGVKTSTGAPVAIAGAGNHVQSVEFFARKSKAAANTGNVFIGFNSSTGQNLRLLTPGQTLTLSAPTGKTIDLSAVFVEVDTSGDGVIYTAIA